MAATTKRPHRRTWKDDPLLEFRTDRLKAVIDSEGVTVSALASELRVPQQTLDYLVRGRNKRCRKLLLEKLAKHFHVSTAWLAGETPILPGATQSVLELFPGGDKLPSRAQLAQSRFWLRCRKAFERDLKAAGKTGGHLQVESARWEFFTLITDLARPDEWRFRFLANRDRPRMSHVELDTSVPALVSFLECVLEPWFKGAARLDYPNVQRWREQLGLAKPSADPLALAPRKRAKHR